jgi:hypothetical protein
MIVPRLDSSRFPRWRRSRPEAIQRLPLTRITDSSKSVDSGYERERDSNSAITSVVLTCVERCGENCYEEGCVRGGDWPYGNGQLDYSAIARWKAEYYKRSGLSLFAEIDPTQARLIAELAKKPVLCPAASRVIRPVAREAKPRVSKGCRECLGAPGRGAAEWQRKRRLSSSSHDP